MFRIARESVHKVLGYHIPFNNNIFLLIKMSNPEKLKKKLHSAFKLSGFLVRREFCSIIVDKFIQEDISLDDNSTFDIYIKNLCNCLEKQCLAEQSIEKQHIDQAIEVCLHAGCDKNETTFSIINAFDFPKFLYDPDRKLYLPSRAKSKLLSAAKSKTQMFIDRYATILQRTQRNFKNMKLVNEQDRLSLQTVDYLLTVSYIRLNRTLILGSMLQVSEGKYYLEDPSGLVQLDLTHAKYDGGFFVENSFVLINGYYEDKILHVSTIILPPGEEYQNSRIVFGNMNYFGGASSTPLRDSRNLQDQLRRNPNNTILFFSDVWLDHPMIFEKLEVLFDGMENSVPPLAFVFMGNFMEELQGLEKMNNLKKLFKQFGELVSHYPGLINNSQFVFIPGMSDPSTPHIVPRFPLPSHITEEFRKHVPKSIFATNPCRLQYCDKEITLFRADVLVKLMQGTMSKPGKDDIAEYAAKTIISQGHLSPLPLNALTVHWDFDYTLCLYPLPNVIVLGDKSEAYQWQYKGCEVINPGSFCDSGFQFKCYTPSTGLIDDCIL